MLGGRFDEHPWGISEATVIVEDRASPMTRHLPASFAVTDEHYSTLGHSRELWDTEWLQRMYFEALRWSLRQ